MISDIVLLILAAGVPYYILLEKTPGLKSKHIFLISALLLLGAIIASKFILAEHVQTYLVISFISALFTIYKATKTTNFYKFAYYLMFVNAPFFIMFEKVGAMYSFSMLICLLGIFLIGLFYEKHYGSANYRYITGITLVRPYIGTFLTFYLVALALYPPFPNSMYFLGYLFSSEPDMLWLTVIVTLFFGNFMLAMSVMKKTLFGRPNSNIHYVNMPTLEKTKHMLILIVLLVLSINGVKEMIL